MLKHELQENTIHVWRGASGEMISGVSLAGVVDVSARCTCGCPMWGAGATLLEAVEALEARLLEHVANIAPRASSSKQK